MITLAIITSAGEQCCRRNPESAQRVRSPAFSASMTGTSRCSRHRRLERRVCLVPIDAGRHQDRTVGTSSIEHVRGGVFPARSHAHPEQLIEQEESDDASWTMGIQQLCRTSRRATACNCHQVPIPAHPRVADSVRIDAEQPCIAADSSAGVYLAIARMIRRYAPPPAAGHSRPAGATLSVQRRRACSQQHRGAAGGRGQMPDARTR